VPLVGDAIEVLTPLEMAAADAWAVENGTSGLVLMERAGLAVAEAARRMVPVGARISVMTGPGNNGGDGFVAARVLAEAGYLVSVGLLTARDHMKGDAAFAAASWTGFTKGLAPSIVNEADLVIDAVFGAGLDRPIDGMAAQTVDAVNHSGVRVLSVDLPSGIDGRTGAILGSAIQAEETVTFFRVKPGHLLMPGREHVGRLTVADIGINPQALAVIGANTWRNTPELWTLPPLEKDAQEARAVGKGSLGLEVLDGEVLGVGEAARGLVGVGAGP
jgi:hydroxyethylthiazole kinase-like uncharacterized protein yjeF